MTISKPLTASFTLFPTAWGLAALSWTRAGVRGLWLPEARRERLLERIAADLPGARELPSSQDAARAVDEVQRYFEGERVAFSAPLDLSFASPFALKVYQALRRIPYGRTATYAEIAAAVGSPRACRAVGGANAGNRIPLLIPCHRVVAAGGKPGGFSGTGGIATKLRLLDLERGRVDCGC
jgi:methylated-DNA-[protein]-cysteine S-methyltransferase